MKSKASKQQNQLPGLTYILENECFITCQLLSTGGFIDYCKKRGISTSREQLEQYERLKLFYPIARVKHFKYKVKVEELGGGLQKNLGILQDGEEWSGEIQERFPHFEFRKDMIEEYLVKGLLWEPSSKRFQSWRKFRDKFGNTLIESFYSLFQCHTLYLINQQTTYKIGLHWWPPYGKRSIEERNKDITEWSQHIISHLQENGVWASEAPIICQIISNRYFPKTRSDRRTVRISMPSHYYKTWNWFEYRRNWNSGKVLADLGISAERIKELHQRISLDATHLDPLEYWYEIVDFASLDQKERLKDKAILAQTFYSMEKMLRSFYKDLTGDRLSGPDDSPFWDKNRFYGKDVTENDLKYLEFLTNKYGLNPRPRIILFVEGDGEYEQFPRLAKELFGCDFPRSRILIENLKGVGNFTGDRRERYGALERYIDAYHSMQTLVFVVLDKEGGTEKIKNKLVTKRSRYYPKRTVTKGEYVHIWDRTVEFDNFTHEEIARAMTERSEQGGNKYEFQASEIANCQAEFDNRRGNDKGDFLSKLYESKCNSGLQKVKLLSTLCDYILVSAEKEFDENGNGKRPIVRIVQRILKLESINHQPINLDLWQKNQESGYFGDLIK